MTDTDTGIAVGVPVRNQNLPQSQGATKSILAALWRESTAATMIYAVVVTLAGSAFLPTGTLLFHHSGMGVLCRVPRIWQRIGKLADNIDDLFIMAISEAVGGRGRDAPDPPEQEVLGLPAAVRCQVAFRPYLLLAR